MERPLLGDQTRCGISSRDLVAASLARQHVRAADLTEYYLRQPSLPVHSPRRRRGGGRGRRAAGGETGPRAAERRLEQRARLRSLGDFSLFMSGFFPDSFRRRLVDVDYYVSMGEYAYGSLARLGRRCVQRGLHRAGPSSSASRTCWPTSANGPRCASHADVLSLYEKWLRTGSERDGQRLVERGITPEQFDRQAIPPVGAFGLRRPADGFATVDRQPRPVRLRRHICLQKAPVSSPNRKGGFWRLKAQVTTPDAAGTETGKGL